MGRNLNQIIAELPPEQQERVEARYQELKQEVEGLRELRQIAGKAQADIATALNIKHPVWRPASAVWRRPPAAPLSRL